MTARRLFSRPFHVHLSVLTVAVFYLVPATVEASEPRASSQRPPDTSERPLTRSDPGEAPEPPPEYDNRSFRSGPPDTTPYIRPAVPEDYAPQGKPAIPPGVTVPARDDSTREESEDDPDRESNG